MTGTSWTSKFIRELWKISWKMWEHNSLQNAVPLLLRKCRTSYIMNIYWQTNQQPLLPVLILCNMIVTCKEHSHLQNAEPSSFLKTNHTFHITTLLHCIITRQVMVKYPVSCNTWYIFISSWQTVLLLPLQCSLP